MIKIDTADIKRLEKDLRTFARQAMPYATRQTLNAAAFAGRKHWQAEIGDKLINRNAFTKSAVRVEKTNSLEIRSQRAVLGSVAPYMDEAEQGGQVRGSGQSKPIATGYAAGQGGQVPRTRLPRRPNQLKSITLTKASKTGRSRLQRNLVAIREAVGGFVYMDTGRRKGIFKITGSLKRPVVRMVWDLSRRYVNVKPTPTLAPAMSKTNADLPGIYAEAMRFQLRRHKVFGY